jgi:CO/xanthine dehydrogenase Mo-binding subunit
MIETRVVGQPVARVDGVAKVTGRSKFSADVDLPGTLWARVLRSPHPHARITRIDASAARRAPGVFAVLTATDLPDPDRRFGRRIRDVPILAHRKVRFVGEAVAAVAAETQDAAEAALDLIVVEYEPLPPALDPARSLEPDAPVIHEELSTYVGLPENRPPDAPPNLQGSWFRAKGDLAQGLAEAEVVFEATYTTPPMHQGHIEPHAVLAHAQADGSLDVWLSNKTPFVARRHLADALDIPLDQVRVHPAAIGGDFGGKGGVMHAPLAAALSRASGRPVRLVLSYVEELLAANPRHGLQFRLRVGARRDGALTAFGADILMDGGAYGGMKPHEALVVTGLTRIAGPYRIPHVRVEVRNAYTTTVPRGHMRSPGEPQAAYARELCLDELARMLDLDPLELRRRNLLREGDETPTGSAWVHPTAPRVVEAAAEAIGWTQPKPPDVGRGIALAERGVGTGRSNAIVRLHVDGWAELITGLPDTGTGAHTILKQIVAEGLGLPPEAVLVTLGGTGETPFDSGAGAGRVSHIAGRAAYLATAEARQKLIAHASELYGWEQDRVVLQDGRIGPADDFDDSLSFRAALAAVGEPLEAQAGYETEARYPESSMTAQAVELAVDPETGQITLRKLVTAHDVGTVLNPITHQGQIEGGLVQALGMTLMEHLVIDESGKVVTLNLGEYKLPTSADLAPLETVLIPGGEGPVPYGGKAIGENSNSAIVGALACAVLDATGHSIRELPISAERIRATTTRDGSHD